MKNFEAQQFRDALATDLKETRAKEGGKEIAKIKLSKARKTEEYATAKKLHKSGEAFLEEVFEMDVSPKESVLMEGELEDEEPRELQGGEVGIAKFIKLKDGAAGVFKSHPELDKEKNRKFIYRERAVYLISRFLRLDIVPPNSY